ncbi:MAG: hypothetical protein ACKO6J_05545 [Crocinitomicaceae bacterium]
MRFLLLLIVFLMTSSNTFSQRLSFAIKDKQTGKTVILKPNKKLVLQTSGLSINGRFQITSDSTILISEKNIDLKDISFLKANPKKKITYGFLLLSTGVGILTGGIVDRSLTSTTAAYGALISIITNTPSYYVAPDYTTSNVLIGSGVATISLAVGILCQKRKFDVLNYEFTIEQNK